MRQVYPADISQARPLTREAVPRLRCALSTGRSTWANIRAMTAKRVDAAVEAIVRRDPSLREWAQVAADGLTAGEGEEALRQAFVQDFLWYRLPAKYPERAWLPVARVAAALLGELALERYAAIAASDTTRAILDAWREDPTRGFARYRAAVEASGVKPPDTDLLAWASVMGFDEASAYARLETTLEEAIMAGRFASGASGWKSRAASLTEDALREPPPHDGRRSWLEMILSERRRAWVEMAHPEGLRRWRAARADEFTGSTDPPDDLEPVVGAMRWLLETCRDRVELTQSGYLSPSIVREGVELFDWWDWPGQPRSEVDVHQLGALRETAARLRLVTRRGRRLGTSRHGGRSPRGPVCAVARCGDDDRCHRRLRGHAERADRPSIARGSCARRRAGGVDRTRRRCAGDRRGSGAPSGRPATSRRPAARARPRRRHAARPVDGPAATCEPRSRAPASMATRGPRPGCWPLPSSGSTAPPTRAGHR